MLVRRRVEHRLRPVRPEREIQPLRMPHIPDDRHEIQLREPLLQLQAEVVHRRLRVVKQDQPAYAESRQLPAQLAADGARGARDQYGLAVEIALDGVQADLDLLAPQQVLDLDFARPQDGLALDHFVHGGDDEALDPFLGGKADQMVFFVPGFFVSREEDGIDAVLDQGLFHPVFVPGTEDRQAFDRAAVGIGVQEADDLVVGGILQAHDGGHALVGGAVDHDALVFVFLLDTAVEVLPDKDHQDADEDQGSEGRHDVDGDEQDVGPEIVADAEYDREDEDSLEGGGGGKVDEVLGGEPPNDDPVRTEDGEGDGGGGDRKDDIAELHPGFAHRRYLEVSQDDVYGEQDQDGGQGRQDEVHREDDASAQVVVFKSLDQGSEHVGWVWCLRLD